MGFPESMTNVLRIKMDHMTWRPKYKKEKNNWNSIEVKKDKARKRSNCGNSLSLYPSLPCSLRAVCGDMQSIKDCMTLQFGSKEFEFQIDMNRNKWRRKSMPYFLITMYCCTFKALMVPHRVQSWRHNLEYFRATTLLKIFQTNSFINILNFY